VLTADEVNPVFGSSTRHQQLDEAMMRKVADFERPLNSRRRQMRS